MKFNYKMFNLVRVERGLFLKLAFILLHLSLCYVPILSESNMAESSSDNELHAQFAKNLGKFSSNMYNELVKAKSNENIIFSPFSIQTCAAMARVGAVGKTAEELDRGLVLISNDREAIADSFYSVLRNYENSNIVKIANKLYAMIGSKFQQSYNELVTKKFFSTSEEIDFGENEAAAKTINTWVESKTNNLIKDLISPDALGRDTRLVLINAIYFKGEWVHAFREDSTRPEDFYLNESNTAKVPMMNQKARFRYTELPELDATALEMPYKDSDLSMLVILPNSRTGLKDLEEKLKDIPLSEITNRMHVTQVRVKFPKFKAEFSVLLNDQFTKLGMGRMFSGGEFTNMLESQEPLRVSKIIHKAFIDVNEKGTEAAAATAMYVMLCSAAPLLDRPKEFYADKPFLYFITNKRNRAILFTGNIKLL